MEYLILFTLMIVIFFVGFGIGLSIPFLLKKYFHLSESNISELKRMENSFSLELSSLKENISLCTSEINKVKDIDNSLNELKKKVDNFTKTSNSSSDVINEWLYGKSGGDINESS